MNAQTAETIAIRALTFIAADETAIGGLLTMTGTSPDDLRQRAGDPEFLAGVMDFLLENDARTQAFCEHEGLAPEDPLRARAALPGGQHQIST